MTGVTGVTCHVATPLDPALLERESPPRPRDTSRLSRTYPQVKDVTRMSRALSRPHGRDIRVTRPSRGRLPIEDLQWNRMPVADPGGGLLDRLPLPPAMRPVLRVAAHPERPR